MWILPKPIHDGLVEKCRESDTFAFCFMVIGIVLMILVARL